MYKKVLSAILFGALTIASTSTFVSCKDYDDDIKNLQGIIDVNDKDNAALHTALTALETKVADMKTQLEAEDARLAALIQSLQTATSENKTAIQNEAKRAAAAEAALEARIATAETAITEIKALLATKVDQKEFDAKVQDIYAKIEAVEANLGSALTQIASLSQGLQNEETARKAAVADLQQQINALNAYTARIQTLEGSLGTVETNVGTLTTQLGQQADQLSNQAATLGTTSTDVETLKSQMATIQQQVAALQVGGEVTVINVLCNCNLKALVFRPDTYYWGIEATTVKTLSMPWYKDVKELTSWIDNESTRNEVIGTKRTGSIENNIINYETADDKAHERYALGSGNIKVTLRASADYHMNPSTAKLGDDAEVKVISANKNYTRAKGTATVSFKGNTTGENHDWTTAGGILTVPLAVTGTVGTVGTDNSNSGVTVFATQVHLADTTITSDYAALIEETVKDLTISHVRYKNANGSFSNSKLTETGMLNKHCGECNLPEIKTLFTQRGLHLFKSVDEAKFYIENTPRVPATTPVQTGEGMDTVWYKSDIDLNELVETHYTNTAGNHDRFNDEDFTRNFEYHFDLTSIKLGTNETNESSHAAIYKDESTGHYFLHPQDPAAGAKIGRAYDSKKASEVVVNRVPLVRVELIYKAENKVVDYAYLPIRIVNEIVLPPTPTVVVTYEAGEDKAQTVVRYNNCWVTGGNNVNLILTNWRNTEEDLFANAGLPAVLDRATFDGLDGSTVPGIYRVEPSAGTTSGNGECADAQQYTYTVSGNNYTFTPVAATPVGKTKFGVISYVPDASGVQGHKTSVFKWDVDADEIRLFSQNGISNVNRAVRLVSSNASYPDIFVVMKSAKLTLKNYTVKGNVHVKDYIIKQYWYKEHANEGGSGDDEIHVNTITPEENDNDNFARTDLTRHGWKPDVMDDHFRDVFLNNFKLISPKDWMPRGWITWEVYENGSKVNVNAPNPPFTSNNSLTNSRIIEDFIFDDSNNGKTYLGYLDNSSAKSFTLRNTYAGDNSKKNLYATYNGITEKIASIATWDLATRNSFRDINIDLNWDSEYAKALLNYKAHNELAETGVLKATVAIVAVIQDNQQPFKYVSGAETTYCPLELVENKFNVRFLRPLSLKKTNGATITDAHTTGAGIQTIKLATLAKDFEDWRDAWRNSPNYEQYYAPVGKNKIVATVENVNPNDFISTNPDVYTDLNGKRQRLSAVSTDLDFKLNAAGDELEYRNLSSTVGTFHVYIPVVVEYYWGKIYDTVTITVNRTVGN